MLLFIMDSFDNYNDLLMIALTKIIIFLRTGWFIRLMW